jgi:hypothetical protein
MIDIPYEIMVKTKGTEAVPLGSISVPCVLKAVDLVFFPQGAVSRSRTYLIFSVSLLSQIVKGSKHDTKLFAVLK